MHHALSNPNFKLPQQFQTPLQRSQAASCLPTILSRSSFPQKTIPRAIFSLTAATGGGGRGTSFRAHRTLAGHRRRGRMTIWALVSQQKQQYIPNAPLPGRWGVMLAGFSPVRRGQGEGREREREYPEKDRSLISNTTVMRRSFPTIAFRAFPLEEEASRFLWQGYCSFLTVHMFVGLGLL